MDRRPAWTGPVRTGPEHFSPGFSPGPRSVFGPVPVWTVDQSRPNWKPFVFAVCLFRPVALFIVQKVRTSPLTPAPLLLTSSSRFSTSPLSLSSLSVSAAALSHRRRCHNEEAGNRQIQQSWKPFVAHKGTKMEWSLFNLLFVLVVSEVPLSDFADSF